MVLNSIRRLGRFGLDEAAGIGRAFLFMFRLLPTLPMALLRVPLLIRQIHASGVLTLTIILVSGTFVGMVLALQSYYSLVNFGVEETVGILLAQAMVRELGPVVTALLFAGRAGSALTAEIGLMKATEQLSALEMMAVDPYARIYAPRMLAGFLAMPCLAAMFSAIGIYGGYLVSVPLLGIDDGAFWSQMQASVSFSADVASGLIKSVVFGFVVTWIALFQGFDAVPTSEGVSRATTSTVVLSSLAVLGLDFVLTALMLQI